MRLLDYLKKRNLTQRAPDWWESARFQAVCVDSSWFRQSGDVPSHPPAGNASRWAARRKVYPFLLIGEAYG